MTGAGTWAASIGLAAVLAATATSLDAYGRSRRSAGPAHPFSAGRAPVVTVDSADDAYRAWRARGHRGRTVVSLSSRLYFVAPDWRAPVRQPGGGGPMNPADALERALDPKNFLLVAVERGVAREIRHVLPESVFAEKVALGRAERGVRLEGSGLSAPEYGTPRLLTTLAGLPADPEPVLLFVSASFFLEGDGAETFRRLSASGLVTDLVVLSRSHDDPGVGPAQREQLAAFAALLGSP